MNRNVKSFKSQNPTKQSTNNVTTRSIAIRASHIKNALLTWYIAIWISYKHRTYFNEININFGIFNYAQITNITTLQLPICRTAGTFVYEKATVNSTISPDA